MTQNPVNPPTGGQQKTNQPTGSRWGLWTIIALVAMMVLACSGLCLGGGALGGAGWLFTDDQPVVDSSITLEIVGRVPTGVPCESPDAYWTWSGAGRVASITYDGHVYELSDVRPETNVPPPGEVRACVRSDPAHDGEAVPYWCLAPYHDRQADGQCPAARYVAPYGDAHYEDATWYDHVASSGWTP